MAATYEALCENGYTELTAQDIADRTDRSKSLLFYHYDSKEDLVADFVDYLLEQFDEQVTETRDLSPIERLAAFVDWFLYEPGEDDRQSFHTAMLELRAQAPYNERYRTKLRESDDRLRETLEEILRAGVEVGQFVDHDAETTAALLIAAFDGARIRQLTLDRGAYLEQVRRATAGWIVDDLLVEDVTALAADEGTADDRGRLATAFDPAIGDRDDADGTETDAVDGDDADASGRGE